jgi:RNA polymerase sigma-70 factor (ECF subfamily)
VALGEAFGMERGLRALGELEADRLRDWLPFHAARAGLAAKAGRTVEACEALRAALQLSPAPAERLFLERRLRALSSQP